MPLNNHFSPRSNTPSGRAVILSTFARHYNALDSITPHIDAGRSHSSKRSKRHRSSTPSHSPRRTLKLKRRQRHSKSATRLKRSKTTDFSDMSERLARQAEIARKERQRREGREHQKRLDKISKAIEDLNSPTKADRRRNRFDPVSHPVVLFRRDKPKTKDLDCFMESNGFLGQKRAVVDEEMQQNLRKAYKRTNKKSRKRKSTSGLSSTSSLAQSESRSKSQSKSPVKSKSTPRLQKQQRKDLKNMLLDKIISERMFEEGALINFLRESCSTGSALELAVVEELCEEFDIELIQVLPKDEQSRDSPKDEGYTLSFDGSVSRDDTMPT